jgi:hypothetical protein
MKGNYKSRFDPLEICRRAVSEAIHPASPPPDREIRLTRKIDHSRTRYRKIYSYTTGVYHGLSGSATAGVRQFVKGVGTCESGRGRRSIRRVPRRSRSSPALPTHRVPAALASGHGRCRGMEDGRRARARRAGEARATEECQQRSPMSAWVRVLAQRVGSGRWPTGASTSGEGWRRSGARLGRGGRAMRRPNPARQRDRGSAGVLLLAAQSANRGVRCGGSGRGRGARSQACGGEDGGHRSGGSRTAGTTAGSTRRGGRRCLQTTGLPAVERSERRRGCGRRHCALSRCTTSGTLVRKRQGAMRSRRRPPAPKRRAVPAIALQPAWCCGAALATASVPHISSGARTGMRLVACRSLGGGKA